MKIRQMQSYGNISYKISSIFRQLILSVLLLSGLLYFTSCAGFSKKFKNATVADIGVFADQTIAMLSEEDVGFSRDQLIYIREYIDINGDEEKVFLKNRQEVDKLFRGIIAYSLKLVTIADREESEQGRIKAYAEYISGWDDEVLQRLGLAPDYYAKVIADVRTTETFLDALRTAQPIVNAAGRWMNQVLDDLNAAIDALAIKIDGVVDEEFREVILYQEALEDEKYAILRSFAKIYRIYKGESEAYKELLDLGTTRRKELITESTPTDEELGKLVEHFIIRLDALHKIEDEIKPDWELYRASHRERNVAHTKALNRISRARAITLVWLRAHQKMASGIVTPAEWFDINRLPSELFKLGTKSIF